MYCIYGMHELRPQSYDKQIPKNKDNCENIGGVSLRHIPHQNLTYSTPKLETLLDKFR